MFAESYRICLLIFHSVQVQQIQTGTVGQTDLEEKYGYFSMDKSLKEMFDILGNHPWVIYLSMKTNHCCIWLWAEE